MANCADCNIEISFPNTLCPECLEARDKAPAHSHNQRVNVGSLERSSGVDIKEDYNSSGGASCKISRKNEQEIKPPLLARIFHYLSAVTVISSLFLAWYLVANDTRYLMPPSFWVISGVIEGCIFAAIGNILCYLHKLVKMQ